MEIKLKEKEVEKIIHSAFCNGALVELKCSDVLLNVNKEKYNQAKERLQKENQGIICMEDVLLEILKNGDSIHFVDAIDEETHELTMDKIKERLHNEEIYDDVITMLAEQDDAWTGYNILQTCLFGEIIYG